MLIGFYSQSMATLQTATFEHFAPLSSRHALAKTMHTHAAAFLGLICSFRHKISSQKIIAILVPGT
jgi:hypothetical protein